MRILFALKILNAPVSRNTRPDICFFGICGIVRVKIAMFTMSMIRLPRAIFWCWYLQSRTGLPSSYFSSRSPKGILSFLSRLWRSLKLTAYASACPRPLALPYQFFVALLENHRSLYIFGRPPCISSSCALCSINGPTSFSIRSRARRTLLWR